MKDDDGNEMRQGMKDEMAKLQREMEQNLMAADPSRDVTAKASKWRVDESFDNLLIHLRAAKPDDRSEADRYYAIVITEVEKAKAVYMTYCQLPGAE